MRVLLVLVTLVLVTLVLLPVSARSQWTEVKRLVQEADRDPTNLDSLLSLAYRTAKTSIAKSPTVALEHLWMANAAGRLAQSKGSREKIELSKVVKKHAEEAVRLDPNLAPAHMTLGAWHFYVADLSWIEKNMAKVLYDKLPDASYEKAVHHLTQAINGNVEFMLETLYIRGLAYDALDNEAKARADFKAVVAMKPRNAKERGFQQDARDWLD